MIGYTPSLVPVVSADLAKEFLDKYENSIRDLHRDLETMAELMKQDNGQLYDALRRNSARQHHKKARSLDFAALMYGFLDEAAKRDGTDSGSPGFTDSGMPIVQRGTIRELDRSWFQKGRFTASYVAANKEGLDGITNNNIEERLPWRFYKETLGEPKYLIIAESDVSVSPLLLILNALMEEDRLEPDLIMVTRANCSITYYLLEEAARLINAKNGLVPAHAKAEEIVGNGAADLSRLNALLSRLVEEEAYEEAARIRDRIVQVQANQIK